jgi:hypothetical protein
MARAPHHGLAHPAFLGALAVLVVNDHLLKGSGALPPWLTGKLSDFAGLIVAPVVVLAVLRGLEAASSAGPRDLARGTLPPARAPERSHGPGTSWHMPAIAMTGVTLLFVVTELSQSAADVVAALAGGLGVPSRLWADPTDLVALAVLPLTWRVMVPRAAEPGGWPLALSRSVLALALVACVATAPRPPSWSTSAFLVNRTTEAVDVRIRWANVSLSCPELSEHTLSTVVSPDVLSRGTTFRVVPDATIPLDDWAALAARGDADAGFPGGRPAGVFGPGCVVALIAIDGIPDTLVLWSTDQSLVVPTRAADGDLPVRGRVDVVASGTGIALTTSADLRAEAYDDRPTVPRCELAAEVGSSEPAAVAGPAFVVEARSDTTDGCVRLDLEMGARPLPFFVCAPGELVPFQVGDSVRIDASDELGVHRTALVGGGRTLVLLRARRAETGSVSVIEGGVTLGLGEPDACGGNRLDCGSFVTPHAPAVSGGAPGEDPRGVVTRTSTTGRAMRIHVARAEWVIAASPLCSEGRDAAGPLLDAAVLYED